MWRYYRISLFFIDYMIQKFAILLLVFCGLSSNVIFANSVNTELNNVIATSFTTNPAAVNGTITICQGQSITYTDTSTGVGVNPTYAWSFPGGNITSSALAGPHTINYTIAGNYTTILSVNGSSSTVNVVVTNASLSNPVITISPNSGWVIGNFNNNNYFNYCANGSSGSLFLFSTNTINTSSTTQHIINWGDGSPNTNVTTANIVDDFHAYSSNGLFQITYTVIQPSGCVFVETYNVIIGINPTASIINYGLPVLCNPGSVQYSIIPGPQNTAETIYTFEVNDGTLPQIFTHAQVTSPGFFVTHFFTSISCGTGSNINGTLYPNSFQASISVSNPCGTSSSAIGPINIQSKPIANITANPSNNQICVNTSIEFTDTTSPGTNIGLSPTFTCSQNYKRYWQITGPAGLLTVGVTGVLNANPYVTVLGNLGFNANLPNNPSIWTNSATNTLNITFNLPGSYSITLFTAGTNSCGITSQTKTICVNPEIIADFTTSILTGCAPTILTLDNLSSLPGCTNTNLYAWQVTQTNPQNCPNASNPSWSFTSGTASAFEPEITFTSAGVYTIQLTTSLQNAVNGTLCQPDIKTKTITIKDKPKTTLSSQTICEGATITLNPTVFNCYATQAVTYLWDFGSNPPTSISSTTSSSPTVTFATAGTYNYTLTLTNECGSNTFSSSIIVNPAVQISASGPSATCLNTGIPLTGSITGGGTTGTWTASITGGTFSPSITALSPTYTPPNNYTGIITFTLTSDDPTGPCPAKTISFQVVVNAQATAEAGTYNPICQNVSLQLNGIVGGAASSGSWTSSNGGTFSDPTSLTSTYSPPPGFVGTIMLTLTTNDPPGPCNPEIDTVIISVIQTPTINTLSNIVVCHNENIGPISFSGTSDTNYSWTNSNPAIGLGASGTSAISFVATNTGNAPIMGTITVTPFNTNGGTSCPGTPTTFTITINPQGQVNAILGQVVCNGDTVTLANLSTTNTGGTTTYAWTSSNTAVGLTTSGNGNIPVFTAVNTTTAPISTIITVTPTFENGGVSCTGTPNTITITVNPTGEVNQPNDLIFCAGTASTAIPFTSANTIGTTNYTWTNDTLGIGLSASGTGNIPVFTPVNNTTNPIVATITVTPTFTDRGKSCIGSSKTFTITINPRGQVNNVSNIIVCNGDTVPALSFSTNITNGTTIFNWVNNTPSIGLISNGADTVPSFTAVNNGTTPITATITVTPQYTNSITCNGAPVTYTIIVNPSAKVAAVTNKTICNGVVLAAINFSTPNISGTTTYTWINDTPSIGLAASGTGNISAFSAINTGTSPIIATIQVTPSYNNNGITCTGSTTSFTITVNPTAQVNPITNQILCNGSTTDTVAFSTNNSGGITSYNWTNSNTAIGLAASGTGTINAFNATNNTANAISSTITVTPNFSNGTPDCSGPSQSFTIIVNPSPAIVFSSANQTICSGDTSALVTLSSTTAGATFTWTATQPTGITGVTTSGTNSIPAQTLVNTTNLPITITYTAVAETNDASACAGSTYNYSITVNPKPAIENQALVICSGTGFTISLIDGIPNTNTIVPTGTTYTWTISTNSNIVGASAGAGNQISQVLTNTTAVIQTIIYTVIPTSGTCIGSPFTITIDVYPKPNVVFDLSNQTICNNTVTNEVSLSSLLPGTYTFNWTANIPTGIVGAIASGTNTIPVQTLVNTTNAPLTITYTATATFSSNGNSCTGNNSFYTITVNPTFIASGVLSNYNGYNVSIFGGNDGTINLTVSGGSGTYTYNWVGPNGFTATTEDLTGLIAGTYTVTINDGYCVPIVLIFTLTQPPELLVQQDPALTTNLLCFGNSNGAVGIQITQESVSPYNYTLLNSANVVVQTITNSTNLNPQFTGLIAGTYSVLVTDANGGTKIVTGLVVSQPDDILITPTITEITCYGANNASITLNVTGGTAPYQANWNNLATGFFQNNLAAGSYTITITDANGCVKPITVIIQEAPIFTINPVVSNISCFGANNGSIQLNLIGGQAPVVLSWSDGSTAGTVRNNLLPGVYSVSISDGTPCYINRTFIIVEPQPLALNATVQNALDCFNASSGAINLVVSGGTPPFSYVWSNAATTEDLSNIPNGNYSVIVTDSRGCIKTASFTISRPSPLTLVLDQDAQVNCATGTITTLFKANVSGGMPPFTINWSSGSVSGTNSEFMSTTLNGLITVTITDANGCTTSQSVTISNPIIGNAGFTQNSYAFTTFGLYSMLDPIQFTNTATGDYISISWNFGDGTFSTEENPIHTYVLEGDYVVTQTVTYPLGCIKTTFISLIIEKGYVLVVPSAFTPNNDSLNDTFRPITKGLKNVRLDIYDTWGSLIYSETGDVIAGWNGKIKDTPAENGNYYSKISAETFYGTIVNENKTFVLIK